MNDWILIKDKLPYGVGKNERPCENCIKTAAEIIERRLLN